MGEFDRALTLTTPHLRGQKVGDAQWTLSGHNVFDKSKLPIRTYLYAIDREYGPHSATATKEAKRLLGYPANKQTTAYGQTLYNLLVGHAKLPDDFAHRRTQLINTDLIKLKALSLAKTQIGTKESPFGSNETKYGQWYGFNGVPWCAIFVSWCISESGRHWKYSYVPNIVDDARYGHNNMSLTVQPEPGDLVSYTINGRPNEHVEIFEDWINSSSFKAVGGNTGNISFNNGGEVMRNVRYMYQVTHFIKLHF